MSTGLDISKLMEKQEELKKRSSGSDGWIQVSKIEKPLDFPYSGSFAVYGWYLLC